MELLLFPLRSTREGRRPGEFPVGHVAWDGQSVTIDCPDREVAARLDQLFRQPLRIRDSRGGAELIMAHGWAVLEPGTEQHFHACVARLHRLGLVPGPQSG